MEEYTPDLITLEDETGSEFTFEIIDEMEHQGERYVALVPYAATEEEAAAQLEEGAELVIMRASEEEGETVYDVVEDDEEWTQVSEIFANRLEELFDVE